MIDSKSLRLLLKDAQQDVNYEELTEHYEIVEVLPSLIDRIEKFEAAIKAADCLADGIEECGDTGTGDYIEDLTKKYREARGLN